MLHLTLMPTLFINREECTVFVKLKTINSQEPTVLQLVKSKHLKARDTPSSPRQHLTSCDCPSDQGFIIKEGDVVKYHG